MVLQRILRCLTGSRKRTRGNRHQISNRPSSYTSNTEDPSFNANSMYRTNPCKRKTMLRHSTVPVAHGYRGTLLDDLSSKLDVGRSNFYYVLYRKHLLDDGSNLRDIWNYFHYFMDAMKKLLMLFLSGVAFLCLVPPLIMPTTTAMESSRSVVLAFLVICLVVGFPEFPWAIQSALYDEPNPEYVREKQLLLKKKRGKAVSYSS